MKQATILFIVIISFFLLTPGCAKPKYNLGILAGLLIDGNVGESKKDKLIIINNGKIIAIKDGNEKDKFQFDTFIDASKKFVIPGLYDMHGHITMNNRTVDTSNGQMQFQVKYDQPSAEWTLKSLLYWGITSVRETGDLLEEGIALKKLVNENSLWGPAIFTCGPLIESFPPVFRTISTTVNTPEQARSEVQRQAKAGVDFIKIYVTVSPEILKTVVEEAHKLKIKVLGHLAVTSWMQAMEAGIDGLVHAGPFCDEVFQNLHSDSSAIVLKSMAEKKVVNDPTLIVFKITLNKTWRDRFLKEYPFSIPAITQQSWDQQNKIFDNTFIMPDFEKVLQLNLDYTLAAHKAGVRLLIGSDFNNQNTIPGISLHQELQLFNEAGVSNAEIIKIATHDAAESLGILDQSGTIEKNKTADILILDKNPLENISNTLAIHKVIRKGKIVDREKLLIRKS